MIHKLCAYFLVFIVFGFGGWLLETMLYLVRDKKVVKRGFLFGPICPIYGVAAVLCNIVIYGNIGNVFLVFFVGMLLAGTLEYVTHFAMEKCFHAMWWDYSGRRFNIKGRVYLKGLLMFGFGVVAIVKLILPLLYKWLDLLPDKWLYSLCFIFYSVIIVDFAATLVDLTGMIRAVKNFQAGVLEGTQKGVDLTTEQLERLHNAITESSSYHKLITENIRRFKKRFPNFTLTKYKHILEVLSDAPDEEKARKDIKLYGTAESRPEKTDT